MNRPFVIRRRERTIGTRRYQGFAHSVRRCAPLTSPISYGAVKTGEQLCRAADVPQLNFMLLPGLLIYSVWAPKVQQTGSGFTGSEYTAHGLVYFGS